MDGETGRRADRQTGRRADGQTTDDTRHTGYDLCVGIRQRHVFQPILVILVDFSRSFKRRFSKHLSHSLNILADSVINY